MKKIIGLFIIIMISVFVLQGCSDARTIRILDENGNELEVISGVKGDTVSLPILAEEGLLFIGYQIDDELVYGSYVMNANIEITAIFEDPTVVFEYIQNNDLDEIGISGYTGNARHLKIPEMIDNKHVIGIFTEAFKESSIVAIEIPNSVRSIGYHAFYEANSLKSITFYGDYYGFFQSTIDEEEFDELVADHEIIDGSIELGSWTYAEGCPIHEVTSYEDLNIFGDIVRIYHVILDYKYYEPYIYLTMSADAFESMPALESIHLNSRVDLSYFQVFIDLPNMRYVSFDEGSDYTVVNSIVYSSDLETLVYYPSAFHGTIFTVPEHVKNISRYAFANNQYLETINIGANVESLGTVAFYNMLALKEINVDADNETYMTEDGVLYAGSYLVCYPSQKPETSFTVPEGVFTISTYAFMNNQYLEEIDFGDEVMLIARYAFKNAQSIEVLNIPESVYYFGWGFAEDSSIASVIIDSSENAGGDSIPSIELSGNTDSLPIFYVTDDDFDIYMDSSLWSSISAHVFRQSEYED